MMSRLAHDPQLGYRPLPRAPRELPAAQAAEWPRVVDDPSERLIRSSADADQGPVVEFRGARIGGFETPHIAEQWLHTASRSKLTMVTAADYHSGYWRGEEAFVLRPCLHNGWQWDEVWDIAIPTDNGHVLLVFAKDRWVHPDTVIFLRSPECNNEIRPSWRTRDYEVASPQGLFRLDTDTHAVIPQTVRPHRNGGQLSIVQDYSDAITCDYAVIWRRDGRRPWVQVLSVHNDLDVAHQALEWLTRNYQPPTKETLTKGRYDRQKGRVYRWESVFERSHQATMKQTLDLPGCEAMALAACQAYGVTPPRVIFSDRLQRKCYYKADTIHLADWGRTVCTVLHEAAHHVAGWLLLREHRKEEPHGPVFAGVLMALYHRHGGIPMEALEAEARKHKLEWEPRG